MPVFRFRSIRTRLSFFLIVLVLVPVFGVFTIYTRQAARTIEVRLKESRQGVLNQTVLNLNRIIGSLSMSVNYLSASPQLQRYIRNLQNDDPTELFLASQDLSTTMQLVSSTAFQHEMFVFFMNDQTVVSNLSDISRNAPHLRASGWYGRALAHPLHLQWTIESFPLYTERGIRSMELLTIARALRSYDGLEVVGVSAVSVRTQDVLDILDSRMVIVDDRGNRLMEDPPGPAAVVLREQLENFWTLEYSLSEDELFGDLRSLQLQASVILFLLMVFLMSIILLYVHSSTQSLIDLRERARLVEQGDLSVRMPRLPDDEIGQLAHQFNGMLDRIETLIQALKEEHQLVEEARFAQLKAQVRPHFLLNSLNTVHWAARMSGADNVSHMISALSKILERALYEKAPYVRLSSELETVKQFLVLEQLRTGDQWTVTTDTDSLDGDPLCPTFCLEPLVENAIKHGLPTPDRSVMEIVIRCTRQQDLLIMEVEDSGKGFGTPPEFLAEPVPGGEGEEAGTEARASELNVGGIGLANIHQRIRKGWGSEYGVRLEHKEPHGTRAIITIPFLNDLHVHGKNT